MGLLWSPVAVVTSRLGEVVNAQIAVAISAASIVPEAPRLLVQIYKENYSHDLIYQSQSLALNFLRRDQVALIPKFGLASGRDEDKLLGVEYNVRGSGCPILTDCWGYLDCRIINAMDGGDMTCFLADVIDGKTLAEGGPLWWRDARRQLPPEWTARWEQKQSSEIVTSRTTMDNITHTPLAAPISE